MTASRTNGFLNLVETLKRRTRMFIKDFVKFPSLLITASGLIPQGPFAEAQAQFLEPNRSGESLPLCKTHSTALMFCSVAADLAKQLREKKVGVVAHFYMDPEVRVLWTRRAWSVVGGHLGPGSVVGGSTGLAAYPCLRLLADGRQRRRDGRGWMQAHCCSRGGLHVRERPSHSRQSRSH